jgi:hypothetical protein
MSVNSKHPLRFDEQFAQTYLVATLSPDIAQILTKNPLLTFQFARELRLLDRLQALHPSLIFEASLDYLYFAMLEL